MLERGLGEDDVSGRWESALGGGLTPNPSDPMAPTRRYTRFVLFVCISDGRVCIRCIPFARGGRPGFLHTNTNAVVTTKHSATPAHNHSMCRLCFRFGGNSSGSIIVKRRRFGGKVIVVWINQAINSDIWKPSENGKAV
jgi:hypothetical protein